MEIRNLRHFVAVADSRSFRRAAERVRLSQQAVSKSISQFETQLGVKLFERDRHSLTLTVFGENLLPYARALLAEAQRFNDVLAGSVGRRSLQLRIGASPTLLDDIVPTSLRRLLAQHAPAQVAIERGDFNRLRDLMLQGELDLILSTAPDEPQGPLVALEQFATDRNVVVVRAGHPLAAGAPVGCEALRTHPRVATRNYRRADDFVAALFAASGEPPPAPAMQTSATEFMTAWVQASDSWWVAPRRLVLRALREGRLAELPVAAPDRSWPLVIATRRHAPASSLVAAFVQLVREVAAEGA